jgi:hypothetical protein
MEGWDGMQAEMHREVRFRVQGFILPPEETPQKNSSKTPR